ncbi:Tat pathway signal protein [Streptomyces sp. NPDC058268]|uniref:Tat pathway signal protein n=1 Tax=Streptomyces sp. NPDC058268 TaxID=3346413 RepID=UPI0036EDB410
MARTVRTPNTQLKAVICELGWSQDQLAARVRVVAAEHKIPELSLISRSHVAQWVRGVQPSGRAPSILCETLSRGLGRRITPAEIGLAPVELTTPDTPEWDVDTLTALTELGSIEMNMERRRLLATAAYTTVGLALPAEGWWDQTLERARSRTALAKRTVTTNDVDSLREMSAFFSRRDQRRGGRAGRSALVAFLHTDVAECLAGHTPSEQVRRELTSVASELHYLAGWMAFDSSEHVLARRNFMAAFHMAAEADDPPLAGHILRAAAHQAVDLGHPGLALKYAEGSLEQRRYTLAAPREKALIGVVHARALAADGRKHEALAALRRAEGDLSNAGSPETGEPGRVSFFTEAALAHETACTLRDLGELKSAEAEFKRSVRTRRVESHARTHSVTLSYLGAVQVRQGHLDAACATWSQALDAMSGVQSGRAREAVIQMRRALSPVRGRGGSPATDLDERARATLRDVG